MNMFIALIFAAVIIGAGITLLPTMKTMTDTIFSAELLATMPPFLVLFVSFWPIFIILFFLIGAYMMIKGKS